MLVALCTDFALRHERKRYGSIKVIAGRIVVQKLGRIGVIREACSEIGIKASFICGNSGAHFPYGDKRRLAALSYIASQQRYREALAISRGESPSQDGRIADRAAVHSNETMRHACNKAGKGRARFRRIASGERRVGRAARDRESVRAAEETGIRLVQTIFNTRRSIDIGPARVGSVG